MLLNILKQAKLFDKKFALLKVMGDNLFLFESHFVTIHNVHLPIQSGFVTFICGEMISCA